jgi:hypothetical protein
MEATLQQEIEQLELLDLEGLRAAWGRRYGAPPSLRSVAILRRLLAWRLQAEALGGGPSHINLERLMKRDIPLGWSRQREALGWGRT